MKGSHTIRAASLAVALASAMHVDTAAAAISAASVERDDVAAAIASAIDGDTVLIPAGSATWSSSVRIEGKAITVQGAGIGQTIIRNTQTLRNSGQGVAFDIVCSRNGLLRVSGIEFDGSYTANILYLRGDLWAPFRVDRCRFANVGVRAVEVQGLLAGLVDNCVFVDCFKTVDVYGGAHADTSWQLSLTLGSTNTVVVEDCTFLYVKWYLQSTGATSSRGQGARSVLRFSTWRNEYDMGFSPIIDAHGNQLPVIGQTLEEPPGGTGNHRGSRQFEMYGNQFWTATFPGKSYRLTDLRGGTCLVFSNTFLGTGMTKDFHVREEDGPGSFDYLSKYPGYDPHMLHLWANTSNGEVITTTGWGYPEYDPEFIREAINLFWAPRPGYSPLEYPHPLRRLSDAPQSPRQLRTLDR